MLGAQDRRLEKYRVSLDGPVTADFAIFNLRGEMMRDFEFEQVEGIRRIAAYVIPSGTFLDTQEKLEEGQFRLPCADSVVPLMTETKLAKYHGAMGKVVPRSNERMAGAEGDDAAVRAQFDKWALLDEEVELSKQEAEDLRMKQVREMFRKPWRGDWRKVGNG